MLIVGELINTSRSKIKEAVKNKDADYIMQVARAQAEAGADYLDVNCGTMLGDERDCMEWLVRVIGQAVPTPLCIDSPDPAVLDAGLALCEGFQPMINSVTLETARYQEVTPLARKYRAKITGLCISDQGMPGHVDDRVEIADALIGRLKADGIAADDIYIDPLVKPISADSSQGVEVLQAIRLMMQKNPGVHTICGLTNISFDLPERIQINRAFMIQTMTAGMDSYIIDITNREMAGAFYASMALLGKDRYCRKYINAYRKGIYGKKPAV